MTAGSDTQADRIRALDFLRGLAILGMLVANIPWHAGNSMSRLYEPDVPSVVAWVSQYLLFDQRFMPIFCMLFGAGAALLVLRSNTPARFSQYFLIRMLILFLIGIAHAYFLWPGDILITYAVCAPFLLFSLKWNPRRLIVLGILLKSIDLIFNEWPQIYELTLEQFLFSWWVDYGEAPSTIIEAYAGGYSDLFAYNIWRNQYLQWTALPYFRIWNALGFMLIGVALFKLGILQGAKSRAFYRRMTFVALALGAPFLVYGVLARIGVNATVGPYLGFERDLPLSSITFLLGCGISSFAVLGGAHLFFKRFAGSMTVPIERVGRMALTNYLLHSLIFLMAFHVFKTLPFDTLDHDALFTLVVATWVFQVVLSSVWLSIYQHGPIETIWRRLTSAFVNFSNQSARA